MSHLALPYQLGQDLTDFKRELLYVGTTYYERYLVFEHIKKPINHIMGIHVTNIELYFYEEKLVAISFFLDKSLVNNTKVLKLIEDHFNQKAGLVVEDVIYRDVGRHIYTWEMDCNKLGLLSFEDTDQMFVQYSLKEFRLYW